MHLPTLLLSLTLASTALANPVVPRKPPLSMPDIKNLKADALGEMFEKEHADKNADKDSESKPEMTSIHASFATSTSATITPTPSGTPSPSASASAGPQMTSCPPFHPTKQCCTSVSGIADQVTGEEGLGGLLPWAEGIEVNSLVGVQCFSMTPDGPNSKCSETVNCCYGDGDGQGGAEDQKSGSQSLFKNGCMPIDAAWEYEIKQAAQNQPASSSSVMASSSMPLASPTGMARF